MSELTTHCPICGEPLMALQHGVAVCSAPLTKPGTEMHGRSYQLTPELAEALKYIELPAARCCKGIAGEASRSRFCSSAVYSIDGRVGLFRRVPVANKKRPAGAIFARTETNQRRAFVRCEDLEEGIKRAFTDTAEAETTDVGPAV